MSANPTPEDEYTPTTPKRIQMSRHIPWRAENPDAVIVARPSKWGNPYKVGEPGWNYYYPDVKASASDAVIMFELDLALGDGIWHERLYRYVTVNDVQAELAGRDLACWCPLDEPCHADVLLEIANGPTP